MLIKCKMSAGLELKESWDDWCEWDVVVEMLEIAESIDDVRGIDFGDGRIVVLVKRDDVVEVGDRGGELPRDFDCGNGEGTFRRWP